ncbi:hypothetical protein [Novipirellula artificiosorum]|uniref:Uncharacterized protein n=1 Tax=Novipirellula artificiosorum TaxID=2528016 RepID=A0A5C6E4F0_9BACT|nr:hypothetical protein [Novipirellula artificiosorum]TWU42306.1 hypothetical protein Poly41_06020 [Novipirellula artificiosorum]
MHKLLSIAFFSLAALVVSSALADGDLDSLLQEITYDEPQLMADVQPVPDQASQLVSESSTFDRGEPAWNTPPDDSQDRFTRVDELQNPNRSAPQPISDPPAQQFVNAPANVPGYAPNPPIPNGQAYGNRNPVAAMPVPQAYGAGCGCGACQSARACDGPSCGCGSCAQRGCGHPQEEYVMIPHRTPNLPSSSILQYFRSDACYTGLWDGYAQERAKQCAKHHKHIHGMCDCAARSAAHKPLDCSLLRASPGSAPCACRDPGCDSCRY